MLLARAISLVAPPLCASCGSRARVDQPLCARCRRSLPWLNDWITIGEVDVWTAMAYEGSARDLVHALKYRGAVRMADTMAAQMAANASISLFRAATLVPVPLHPSRERRRGFNQAELLATALASRLNVPAAACLTRSGSRRAQVGRGRAERLSAEGADIALLDDAPPTRIVLVDDVVTTGGTIARCAQALDAGSAREVVAVAYARTLRR